MSSTADHMTPQVQVPAPAEGPEGEGVFSQLTLALSLWSGFGAPVRRRVWRQLGDLMTAGLSLPQAFETVAMVSAQNGSKSVARVLRFVLAGYEGNMLLVRIGQVAPPSEALLFRKMGEVDPANLFYAAARSAEQKNMVRNAVVKSTLMPVGLIFFMGIMLYMMGSELFPAIEGLGSLRRRAWHIDMLSSVSQGFVAGIYWILGGALLFIGSIWMSLGHWTGWGRSFADRFAPYSLYKLTQGTGFILAVVELGRMKQTLSGELLEKLSAGASPYLRSRIRAIAEGGEGSDANGGFGSKLQAAGHEFPSRELITVISALDGTGDDWLERFAEFMERWLVDVEARVKAQMAALNMVLMVLASVVMAVMAVSTVNMVQV